MLQLSLDKTAAIDFVNLQMYDGSFGTYKASCGKCAADDVVKVIQDHGLAGMEVLVGFPSGRAWYGSADGMFGNFLGDTKRNPEVASWAKDLMAARTKGVRIRGFMTWCVSQGARERASERGWVGS